jgi:hypothetical protein
MVRSDARGKMVPLMLVSMSADVPPVNGCVATGEAIPGPEVVVRGLPLGAGAPSTYLPDPVRSGPPMILLAVSKLVRRGAYGRRGAAELLPESGVATYGVGVPASRECMLTTERGSSGVPHACPCGHKGWGRRPNRRGGRNACPDGPQVRRGFAVPSGARVGADGHGNRVGCIDLGGPGGPQSWGASGGTGASVEPVEGPMAPTGRRGGTVTGSNVSPGPSWTWVRRLRWHRSVARRVHERLACRASVCIEMGGPGSAQSWGPCGATDAYVEPEHADARSP